MAIIRGTRINKTVRFAGAVNTIRMKGVYTPSIPLSIVKRTIARLVAAAKEARNTCTAIVPYVPPIIPAAPAAEDEEEMHVVIDMPFSLLSEPEPAADAAQSAPTPTLDSDSDSETEDEGLMEIMDASGLPYLYKCEVLHCKICGKWAGWTRTKTYIGSGVVEQSIDLMEDPSCFGPHACLCA